MKLRSRPFLLFSLIAMALMAFTEGGGIWEPKLAFNAMPGQAERKPAAGPAAALRQEPAAAAAQPGETPAQTPLPRKAGPSLGDEVKRVQRERLACVAEPGQTADIFASKSWYVPPPPPPPKPPPPPTAPPLPFGFMGSYQEADGKQVFFLTKGENLYTVSSGDVIDGIYRVEAASAGRLELTYLPLNIRQALNMGGAS
mgnify:CR=1 FL=1